MPRRTDEVKECPVCHVVKPIGDFYLRKDRERMNICKQCATAGVKADDESTFAWILEELDMPFIRYKWVEMVNRAYQRNPKKFNVAAQLGIYIRTMTMAQWIGYGWADSERLNEKGFGRSGARGIAMTDEERAGLDDLVASGGMTPSERQAAEAARAAAEVPHKLSKSDFAHSAAEAADEEMEASLTPGDRQYLINKWGATYSAREWLRMEDLYTRYAAEYEMSVDREEALKKICKTSLKLDQALDVDDANTVKALSSVLDNFRKSAKFTEVQNKEDGAGMVSSVGQLVLLCEREGGIIEQLPPADEYPRDKIDLTINDYKQYAVSLLRNEPNISGLIEAYVAKLDEAQRRTDEFLAKGSSLPSDPFAFAYDDEFPDEGEDAPLAEEDADYIRALLVKDGAVPEEEGLDVDGVLASRNEEDLYYL